MGSLSMISQTFKLESGQPGSSTKSSNPMGTLTLRVRYTSWYVKPPNSAFLQNVNPCGEFFEFLFEIECCVLRSWQMRKHSCPCFLGEQTSRRQNKRFASLLRKPGNISETFVAKAMFPKQFRNIFVSATDVVVHKSFRNNVSTFTTTFTYTYSAGG